MEKMLLALVRELRPIEEIFALMCETMECKKSDHHCCFVLDGVLLTREFIITIFVLCLTKSNG